MLFDPQQSGAHVAVAGGQWQPKRIAAARCGSAHDFLTLPAIGPVVPTTAVMRWRADQDVCRLIADQFVAGPLRTRDVPQFLSAGEALAQGFFAWANREMPRFKCLNFNFVINDVEAVHEQMQYQYDASDFESTSPLYLGIENAGREYLRYRKAGGAASCSTPAVGFDHDGIDQSRDGPNDLGSNAG